MGALESSTTMIYGIHLRESATDGSDFANGATDYRVVFLGEDGQLHAKDSTGTVTDLGGSGGSVATDAIWDAAGDLAIGSGANTAARLAIGTNGQVLTSDGTTAAWAAGALAYSGASVYRDTSAQSISSNTQTAIAFNAEEWDTDTYHDNSTNPSRLTAPVTGRYRIEGYISLQAIDNTEYQISVRVNGTDVGMVKREEVAGTSTYRAVSFATVKSLTAGQYVEIYVYQASGAFEVQNGANRTQVHIQRLS